MKKIFVAGFVLGCFALLVLAAVPPITISQMPRVTTLNDDALFPLVQDAGNKAITWNSLATIITDITGGGPTGGVSSAQSTNIARYQAGLATNDLHTTDLLQFYLASNPLGFITASALTPYYLASNPSGYMTASALSPYLLSATATSTFVPSNAVGTAAFHAATDFISAASSNSIASNLTNSYGTIPATRVTGLGGGGDMLAANNLSEVTPGTARTNLAAHNASNLSSGTVADARLSANVPLLNAATQTFAGDMGVLGVISGNGSGITGITNVEPNGHINVKNFGALGDGICLSNCQFAASSTNLLTNSFSIWTAGDVGKLIVVNLGTNNSLPVCSTITQYVSGTSIRIANYCSTPGPSCPTVYGNNDKAAFKASGQYWATNGYPVIHVPAGIYCIGGPFDTVGNSEQALITIPHQPDIAFSAPTYALVGDTPPSYGGAGSDGWANKNTVYSNSFGTYGTIIVAMTNVSNTALLNVSGTNATPNGYMAGYYNGVGTLFQDLEFRMPSNPLGNCLDLQNCPNFTMTRVLVDSGYQSYSGPTLSGSGFGVYSPNNGNNGPGANTMTDVVISGMPTCLMANEHVTGINVMLETCYYGLRLFNSGGGHLVNFFRLTLQGCVHGIMYAGSDPIPVNLVSVDFEHGESGTWRETQYDVDDPSGLFRGNMSYTCQVGLLSRSGPFFTIQKLGTSMPWNAFGTNAPSAGQVPTYNGSGIVWSNSVGSQTPLVGDINGAGKSITNLNSITTTNGFFVTGTIFPVASMANGSIQLWNSNATLFAICKSTSGTVTTNKIAP